MELVINENAVDIKIISTANLESPSYFSANIAVVLPAGIPASTVDTAITNGATLNKVHPNKTNIGITNKRIIV